MMVKIDQQKLSVSEIALLRSFFAKIEKYKLLGFSFFLFVGQAFYIVLPAILGLLIDSIFVKGSWNITWLFLFPIVWSVSQVFLAISRFFTSIITQDIRKISKAAVFKYLINLSNSVYVNKGAGEVESLAQEISFNSRYIFAESIPFFIRILVSLVFSVLILAYSSIWLGLLFVCWMIIYVPISYLIAKNAVHLVSHSLVRSSEVSSLMVDVIENHELVPAFGKEEFEIKNFQNSLDIERKAYIDAQLTIDKADLLQHFLQLLLPFSIVSFIVFFYGYLEMTPGDIVALFTVILIVTAQVRDLGKGVLAFLEVKERMKTALRQLLDFQKFSVPNIRGTQRPSFLDIRFEKVSYTYETGRDALRNITLTIKENEKIGIVGYSGAGKSTFTKLLRGFYMPSSGKIVLGNVSLNDVDPQFLAENISEVSQTVPLFHRSIRENVAYGSHEVSDTKIWEMLERAQFADYVKKLSKGLDTIIGVKGTKFSGGERARLAIARAFLKGSKIIILDEATAALDSESELLLQEGLKELMTGRTVIAIAHRLSTLKSMNRIVMFEKGKVEADGVHSDLIKNNEAYMRLWNMQVLI